MILITLDMTVSSHNRLGIIRTFRQLIGPTESRPGCLGCRLLQDIDGGERLLYLEAWHGEEDLERRVGSSSFRKILALMELSSDTPQFSIHSIARCRGLESISSIRQSQQERRAVTGVREI